MIASASNRDTASAHPFSTSLDRELLIARLKSCGLRITAPRIFLLEALSSNTQPTTIEQLFARTGAATCDLVTIYRAMAAFERAGIVYRSGFSARGAVLYSAHIGGTRRYPLVRKGTAVIEELDSESSAELQAVITRIKQRLQGRGYEGLEHIVEFFAIPPAPTGNPSGNGSAAGG